MKRRLSARWRAVHDAAHDGDRGSGAIAVVIFALLFVVLASFVVDGGMAISRRERAADLAEQAARAAAQDIDVDALRSGADLGENAPINYQDCPEIVSKFLTAAGLSDADVAASGCVEPLNAQEVTVRVQLTYKPMVSALFLTDDQHTQGIATAQSLTQ